MPFTTPTYADFITRFPVFDNVAKWPQATVEAVLAECANNIDTSWFESDYQPAIMNMAAHILSTEANAAATAPTTGAEKFLASESFAGMSRSYSLINAQGSFSTNELWGSTSYGRRYLDLLRKNKPGPVVA